MEFLTINAITAEQARMNVQTYNGEMEKVLDHDHAVMLANILSHLLENVKERSEVGLSTSKRFRLIHGQFLDGMPKTMRTVSDSWSTMIEYNLPVHGIAGNFKKDYDDQADKESLFYTLRQLGYSVITDDQEKKVYYLRW